MNMKTTKFLAVLAVFAMAFAGFAVIASEEQNDASSTGPTWVGTWGAGVATSGYYINGTAGAYVFFDKDSYTAQGTTTTTGTTYSTVFTGAIAEMQGTEAIGDGSSADTTWAQWFADKEFQNNGYGLALIGIPAADGDKIYAEKTVNGEKEKVKIAGTETDKDNQYTIAKSILESGTTFNMVTAIEEGEVLTLYFTDTSATTTYTYVLDFTGLNIVPVISGFTSNAISLEEDSLLAGTVTINTAGDYTVELNGFTLYDNARLFVADKAGVNLTIDADNGSMVAPRIYKNPYMNGCDLIVDGGTYVTEATAFLIYSGTDSTENNNIQFNGATIVNDSEAAIWVSNNKYNVVTVEDTYIYSGEIGIFLGCVEKATLENVTVMAEKNAVEIKSGDITVIGGSYYSSTYEQATGKFPDSGSGVGVNTFFINACYSSIVAHNTDVTVTFEGSPEIVNAKSLSPITVVAGTHKDTSITTPIKINGIGIEDCDIVKDAGNTTEITIGSSDIDVKTNDVDAETDKDTYVQITENTEKDTTVKEGVELIIATAGEATFSGNLTMGTGTDAMTVSVSNLSGKFMFQKGSIVMEVIEWDGGSIELSDKDVLKVYSGTGAITGDVTITGPETGSATILVDEGNTLAITGTLHLKNKLVMSNSGSIIGDGTIDVQKDAYFYSSNPVSVNFTGAGEIDIDDATEKVYLSGTYTSTNTYSATQEVIVNGNLTIMSGAYIIINGGLKVLDGVTVTIQDGGMLEVTSVTAYADIAGTIKSNGTMAGIPGFYVDYSVDGDVEISGSIIAAKAPTDDQTTVAIYGEVYLTGTLTVNIKAAAAFGELYVTDGGELINNGMISGSFYNESKVTINGKVADETTIYMYADDATVNIASLTSGTLTINDLGAYLGKKDGKEQKVTDDNNNFITFSEIAGVVVSENIYSYTYNNEKKFVNQTLLSGDATKATSASDASITVTEGIATVAEELSLLKANMVVKSDAKLSVSGTIYAINTADDYELSLEAGAKMTVTGLVRSTEIIEFEAGINAVRFTSVLLATTYYNYTTLAAAIEAEAKDITVLGDLYVNTDTTIPAGMAVDASNSTVFIGVTMAEDDTSVILTVAKGGSLIAKKIDVRGSLAIENADTGIACSNIISDTYTTDDVSELYTNITTALKNAGLGDVVKITKKEGNVVLSKNATVALGATLVIPAGKTMEIADKVTLTVEGAIENKGTISGDFDEEADDDNAAIALSGIGTIQSSTEMKFDNFHIPGAYFEYKALYCITTVVGAQAWIALAEDSTIDIRGTGMAFGDVAFEGTADVQAVINVHSNMISGTITLSDAKIVIDAGRTLDVTIAGAGGTIVFAGVMTSKDSTSTIETITDDDSETILTMTAGSFEKNSKSKLDDKAIKTTFDGIVMIDGAAKLYTPSVKGVLGIAKSVIITGAASVSGVLAIDEDVTVTMMKTLNVSGSMTVGHGSTVAVNNTTDNKPSITVTGSIIAAEKDEDGAKATVTTKGTLTTGSNDYAGADAVISGDVTAAFYKVYDGTTFEGKIAETLTDLKDAGKYTEFYVLDALWFTYLYSVSAEGLDPIVKVDKDGIAYNYQPKGLVDSVFSAWQKKVSGKLETITTSTAVGGEKAVYALIDYNIYDVTIKTDAGIKSVSIDGIIMVNSLNNVFTLMDLAAGTHKVTYELKNGYSGTAVLSTSTGTILKDNSFALSGTEVTDFVFQLAGTEPTPEPEPVVPEKESEWTITTILLVILVILIAIMAVIVALRLNRS